MRRCFKFGLLVLVPFSFACDVVLATGIDAQFDALLLREDYAQARSLAEGALANPESRREGLDALFNLAIETNTAISADEADRWIDELAAMRSQQNGERSRSLAPINAWQAERAFRNKDFSAANLAMRRAQELLVTGEGTIDLAEHAYVESFAAQLSGLQGHFADALKYAQHAVDLLEHPGRGLDRLRLIRALYFLAMFHDRNGDYAAAMQSAQRGLKENAQSTGDAHNSFRRRLNGMLAEILISRGEFAAVDQLLTPELDYLRSQATPSNRDMAYTFGHLAEAKRHLGDRDLALQYARESAEFAAKDPAIVASGSYAAILGNLGSLEFEMGRYVEADAALAKNLGLTEQQFGADSVRMVAPLTSAGEVALARDLLDLAEAHFRRALAIVATELGPQHPEGAAALRGLGNTLLRRGLVAQAEPMLYGAFAQRRASIGEAHPELLAWRCDLALAQARNGHSQLAWENALAAEHARSALVNAIAPALGDIQSLDFKRGLGHCSGLMLALAVQRGDTGSALAAWTEVAAARGLATRIAIARLASARAASESSRQDTFAKWTAAARAYAAALGSGSSDSELQVLRDQFDLALRHLPVGQDELNWSVPELAQSLKSQPAGRTLLAYVQDATVPDLAKNATEAVGAARMYAFVATADSEPRLVDLGDSAAIGALAQRWYANLHDPDSKDFDLRAAGLALRARMLDPLGIGANPGSVLVVPDASLFRVNLAALPADRGYLVEQGWHVHMLDTEQDLLRGEESSARQSMLLIGGQAQADSTNLAQVRRTCPSLGEALLPLPGAKREMATLARLALGAGNQPVTTLSGRAATTAALQQLARRSGIIHFATHTVQLGAECAPLLADNVRRGVGLRRNNADASDARSALANQPALVLADDKQRSGLLFAADVETLALAQTSWVVLSACDTGLGTRLDDEGVFGLRRAFRLAGARTVVMSLWQVDDAATASWMEALYSARLRDKHNTVDSVAEASLSILADRRAKGVSTHPYYWAAFIASGDWR